MDAYIKLVPFLKKTLSDAYEVILFDTTSPKLPVLASSRPDNEYIRCARTFVTKLLKIDKIRSRGMILNRPLEPSTGKLVRTSVFLISNDEGGIRGALCILMTCNTYMKLQKLLSSIMCFDIADLESSELPVAEEEYSEEEPSLDTIRRIIGESEVDPARFTQTEKLEIILDLYDMGAFKVKGGVAETARLLKMSEQSVYRYINKIKKARN